MTPEQCAEALDERVLQFKTLSLPGQPMMMHMGTSYLVTDLHAEVKRLRALVAKETGCSYPHCECDGPAADGGCAAKAEPVAWAQLGTLNGKTYLRRAYDHSTYPPSADVVRNLNLVPLYAHPPAAETDDRSRGGK